MESNDISKRTVLVLLVLTLVVSVVGTWTILSQPTTIYKTIDLGSPEHGSVGVRIGGEESNDRPVAVDQSGTVGIKIK